MLMQLGSVTFEIAPFNTHTYSRDTGADYVPHDVMGVMRPREFMGEGDEAMVISGRLFPHKFGGLGGLDALDAMRKSGVAQILVRGDGRNLGWFMIEKVNEVSDYLNARGVGKRIEFDVSLARSPKPAASNYLWILMRLFG